MDFSDLSAPPPSCPGVPSLAPGVSALEDGLPGPSRQAWAAPHTPLCIRFAGKAPGVRMRRVFLSVFYVLFMNGLHSGQGGALRRFLPTDARGLGCPGPSSPATGPASWEPQAPPLGGRPLPRAPPQTLPHSVANFSPVYAKASAATPPQGPAPLAAAFVTSLHAAPTLLPSLPGAARSLLLLVSPKPTIEQ